MILAICSLFFKKSTIFSPTKAIIMDYKHSTSAFIAVLITLNISSAQAQKALISLAETKSIINTLASDNMRGRKVFTPDIDKAATFIANEFKAAGLQPFPADKGFLQPFEMESVKPISAWGELDSKSIAKKK